MGLISKGKADSIESHAVRAWEEGRRVFAPLLVSVRAGVPASGPVTGWAEMIEAVEAVGWRLEHWSVTSTDKLMQAAPLFRRP